MNGALAVAGGGLSEVGVSVGRAVRGRLGLKARESGYGGERASSVGPRDLRAAHCPRPGVASPGGQDSARQCLELPSPTEEPGNRSDSLPVLVSVDFLLCRVIL